MAWRRNAVAHTALWSLSVSQDTTGRFGIAPAKQWGLWDEFGAGEAFQALELGLNRIPTRTGTVEFAPEFRLGD